MTRQFMFFVTGALWVSLAGCSSQAAPGVEEAGITADRPGATDAAQRSLPRFPSPSVESSAPLPDVPIVRSSRSPALNPQKACEAQTVGTERYLICNEPRPWSEAREVCEAQGMALAQFVGHEPMVALGALLNRDFWLGGSDRVSEGDWRWTDGTTFKRVPRRKKPSAELATPAYVHESFEHVKVDFGRNCLRWHVDRWDAQRCGEALPFVCQTRPVEAPLNEDSRAGCTNAELAGHRYLVCSDARSWQEAEAHCNRNDMHLATLQSHDEAKFVAELISSDSFIGLVDSTHRDFKAQFPTFPGSLENGIWRNIDDNRAVWCGYSKGMSTPLSYAHWGEEEPRSTNLGCATMVGSDGSWHAASCTQPLAYVCEQIDEGKPDAFATSLELATGNYRELEFLPGTLVTSPMLSLEHELRIRACVDLYWASVSARSFKPGTEQRWYVQTVQGYDIGESSGQVDVQRDLSTQAVRSMSILADANLRVPLLPTPKLSEREAFVKVAEILGVAPETIADQAAGKLEIRRKPRVVEELYEFVYAYRIRVVSPKRSELSDTHYVAVHADSGQLSDYSDGVIHEPRHGSVPTPRGGAKTVVLTAPQLMGVVQHNRAGLTRCYAHELKAARGRQPAPITVLVTVAPSGAVTKVLMQGTTSGPMNDCLRSSVKRWRFPKASQESEFAFPLSYLAQGN